jgi:homoserine kinase
MNERIRRITEELWGLHEELSSFSGTSGSRFLERPALSAFKAAVDHMRLLVWALIQGSREAAEGSSDQLLNSVRAERVTEMLKALHHDLEAGKLVQSPAGRTMLAEISSISNRTFDRYR